MYIVVVERGSVTYRQPACTVKMKMKIIWAKEKNDSARINDSGKRGR